MGELLILQGDRIVPKGRMTTIGVGPSGPLAEKHDCREEGGGMYYSRDRDGNRICIPTQKRMYYDTRGSSVTRASTPASTQDEIITGSFLAEALSGSIEDLLDGSDGQAHATFIPGFVDARWAASLSLPSQSDVSPGKTVTLVGNNTCDKEFTDPEGLQNAYAENPGTRLRINVDHGGGWLLPMAERISGRFPSHEPVFTLYESNHGDRTFGRHSDASPGIAFQLGGGKKWTLDAGGNHSISMRPGDVVVLPAGVQHDVFTPANPGHSTHLLMTFVSRSPKVLPRS